MKKKVVLIIGIIICTTLGVLGFIQNKNKLNTPLDNKENTNQDYEENNDESKENDGESKVKTYQPVKYAEDFKLNGGSVVNIYCNNEVIYLVDNRSFWHMPYFLYTLKNNKLESTETFDSNDVSEMNKRLDSLESKDNNGSNEPYSFITKDRKIGVTNDKGEFVLNAEFDISDANKIYKLNDKYYFFLSKKGEKYLYNSEGKLIYEFKDYYEYSFSQYYDNFIMMNIENEVIKSLDFYDKNFKHIKNENLEKYDIKYSDIVKNGFTLDKYTSVYISALNIISKNYSITIFPLKNNSFLAIDKDLNIREIKNLYVEQENYDTLYYFENYYVTYNGENDTITYDIYSYSGELIVSNLTKVGEILYNSDGSLIVCKAENKCTVMNKYGKTVTDYKYSEWHGDSDRHVITLINNSETYIYSMNEDVKDWTCNVKLKGGNYYVSYIDNDYVVIDYDVLYGKNCKEISGNVNYSIKRYKDILLAEKSKSFLNDFLLIVKDNEIVYESDAKIGDSKIIDNKIYFIMSDTLYYIEL